LYTPRNLVTGDSKQIFYLYFELFSFLYQNLLNNILIESLPILNNTFLIHTEKKKIEIEIEKYRNNYCYNLLQENNKTLTYRFDKKVTSKFFFEENVNFVVGRLNLNYLYFFIKKNANINIKKILFFYNLHVNVILSKSNFLFKIQNIYINSMQTLFMFKESSKPFS